MTKVRVVVTPEHLRELHGTPVAGLLELIHNALDADATTVAVAFERNAIGGLASVTVTDNGIGMSADELQRYFGPIGSSWKQHGSRFKTPGGRRLLGHKGRGRIGAFALGPRTQWRTVSAEPGEPNLVRKSFGWRDDADEFDVDSEVALDGAPGTKVTVTDVYPAADRVTSEQAFKEVGARLAEYLVKYPSASITIDGEVVRPGDFIVRRHRLTVDMAATKDEDPILVEELAAAETEADVEVLEWAMPTTREMWFFDRPSGDTPADLAFKLPAQVRASGISYTVTVHWDGVAALKPTAEAGDLSPAVARMKSDTETVLREYMRRRVNENRSDLLKQWKSEGSYPYEEDPLLDEASTAEQELFDVIAVAASPAFVQGGKKTRSFALELLKTTIRSDASAIGRVLEKVLDLDEVHLTEIDELLRRVSLVSMIEISKEVTQRVVFLDWLEAILNDDVWVRNLRERGGLQSIMENNTWVLGDQWQSLVADRALRSAITQMRDDLGPVSADDVNGPLSPAVRDAEGRTIRVDLLLARTMRAARRRQHLVVELKRPSRTISKSDLDQVENYFGTVINSPMFDDGRIDWTFILVGRKFDDTVNRRRSAADREHGLVDTHKLTNGATYQLWVRSWSEVIEDARSRLAFVKEHLPDFPETDDLEALTQAHDYLLASESAPSPEGRGPRGPVQFQEAPSRPPN